MKQSGILLHISSLDTEYGIGDLGPSAYRFADYLSSHGHTIWQILPLNLPGYGDSPYNPISAFALNEYLISPDLLVQNQLLLSSELITLPRSTRVDYPAVYTAKNAMHALAANRYLATHDIEVFIEANATYLKPYLCFVGLSHKYGDTAWYNWNPEHRQYSEELYQSLSKQAHVRRSAALQAIFENQMQRLKDYVSHKGITMFGDMPLYLSYESAEVWANQHFFDLDGNGARLSMAGVPPDAFAENGQLWGNPTYLWERLQEDGFRLFVDRIQQALKFMDILRLDHFIGYVNYWKVPCPAGETPDTAKNGSWVQAMPKEFFRTLMDRFESQHFVAEDLGILNSEVCRVRDELGLPGMIVLQFCFEHSVPLVQDYPSDRLIYSGTHDNNTTRGWWDDLLLDSASRSNLRDYCQRYLEGMEPESNNVSEIIRMIAGQSACQRTIFPMQDILNLGSDARMNIPGTALGNWQWRWMARNPGDNQ